MPKKGRNQWKAIQQKLKAGDFILNELFPVVAAAYITRNWDGEPLWMMAVSPPGSGKTCTVELFSELTDVVLVSSVSPAGLISGWGGEGLDPSLFARLSGKLLIAKDFGTLLSSSWETVNMCFGLLREAYDGHVRKVFGNNVTREYWDLHFNFVAATTEAGESSQTLRTQLGERFLRFNNIPIPLPSPPPVIHQGLKGCVANWMQGIETMTRPTMTPVDHQFIAALASVTAKLRTEVLHDGQSKEIKEIPGFEGSARLEKQIAKLFQGLMVVLDGDRKTIKTMCTHAAMSAIRPSRMKVIETIREHPLKLSAVDLADELRLGYSAVRMLLNDMYAMRIIERERRPNEQGANFPNVYCWQPVKEFNEELDVLGLKRGGKK